VIHSVHWYDFLNSATKIYHAKLVKSFNCRLWR